MDMRVSIMTLLSIAVLLSGCTTVLGPEGGNERAAADAQFIYKETLRDQESLRGESLKDIKTYSDPAKAAQALQRPTAVAADAFRVYATDRVPDGRLTIFDRSLRTMTTLTAPMVLAPAVAAPYREPSAVAVDAAGYVYIADPLQSRVFGLDRDGRLLYTIGLTGDLVFPSALAMDSDRGRLYVADRNSNVVRVYGVRGTLLLTIGGGGTKKDLRMPIGIAVDRSGRCYVLDGAKNRVLIYDGEGKFLSGFPITTGRMGAAVKPAGMAVDSAGRIYVSDTMSNSILIFDGDGAFLQQWGKMGNRQGEFWHPSGIFIDKQDTIFIADQMNGRIQVYERQEK